MVPKSSSALSDNFIRSCSSLNDMLNDYTGKAFDRILGLIQESLYNRLIYTATATSQLCAYDERTYTFYVQLMQYYRDILFIYGNNERSITTEPLKSILGGIVSILDARVMADYQHYADNPVLLEKQHIATQCGNDFIKAFQGLDRKDLYQHTIPLSAFTEGIDSAINEINTIFLTVNDELLKPIYKLYDEHLKITISALDNLERRVIAVDFFETLKKEYEILNAIITVQISAIEEKSMHNLCTPAESALLFNILTYLREVYQHFSKEIAEISNCFEGKYQILQVDFSFDDFCGFIASFASGNKVISPDVYEASNQKVSELIDNCKEGFKALIHQRIKRDLIPFGPGHANYQINKIISENKTIANELIQSFKKISAFYSENCELLAGNSNIEILEGINSTISIKIESIEENFELFNTSMLQLQESSSDKIKAVTDEEIEELINIELRDIIDIHNDMNISLVSETDAYEKIINKRKTAYLEVLENAKKKSTQYKREYLLFEISTYEEIMNYSVSRLRETGDSLALKFVSVCDGVQNEISIILRHNNINTIIPLPHDLFNGKEHEVLMAEKSDEFQKGEIIKVMNSGFKCGDLVLIRANVIAAK